MVGRGPDVDLSVEDEYVSTRHALLIWDPASQQMTIEDLGSTNGTFVNGRRIGASPVRLQLGDTIRVGRTDIPWSKPI